MNLVLFCHSLLSDWNHGNAHFLRGVCTELALRGHSVRVYEQRDAWSVRNLVADHGEAALDVARRAYPSLDVVRYERRTLDLDGVLGEADLVLVHEWSEHELVARLGAHRAAGGRYKLLFHDTHHRAISDPEGMGAYDLRHYDGVLAFGRVLRDLYLERGWSGRAFTWHEAADTRVFRPLAHDGPRRDVVWVGNWGDDERTQELHEFLMDPVARLGLSATVYGVRYPEYAEDALQCAGIDFGGFLPNPRVPEAFARHRMTVHVPRRPYVKTLPGIPTIRPFEAMACGIPLVSAPWDDVEGLFRAGRDYLVAKNGEQMREHMRDVLHDPALAAELARSARETILARHTCAHRVDELLAIATALGASVEPAQASSGARRAEVRP
jgi:spore maturation protein CgeB